MFRKLFKLIQPAAEPQQPVFPEFEGNLYLRLIEAQDYAAIEQHLLSGRIRVKSQYYIKLPHYDKGYAEYTPLHIAAAFNDFKAVQLLFKYGAKDSCITFEYAGESDKNYESSALHLAVQHDQLEMTKLLLNNGVNVNQVNNKNVTPLFFTRSKAMLALLIANRATIDCQDKNDTTPLETMIPHLDDETLQAVFQRMSSWNGDYLGKLLALASYHKKIEFENYLKTVLLQHEAFVKAAADGNLAAVNEAIEQKLNLNYKQKEASFYFFIPTTASALYAAAERHDADMVRTLVKNGVDVNQWIYGSPELHRCVDDDDLAMVQLLLELNADPNRRNIYARTPLFYLSHTETSLAIAQLLLQAKADANMKEKFDLPIESLLEKEAHPGVIKLLFENTKAENQTDRLLRRLCAHVGPEFTAIAADLINRFSLEALNRVGDYKRTALHAAAYACNLAVVKLLLARDVEINCKDDHGYTPLHLVCLSFQEPYQQKLKHFGQWEQVASDNAFTIAQLLLAKGAILTEAMFKVTEHDRIKPSAYYALMESLQKVYIAKQTAPATPLLLGSQYQITQTVLKPQEDPLAAAARNDTKISSLRDSLLSKQSAPRFKTLR